MEMFFAKNFARYHKRKNITWNIRHLVNESFVPLTSKPAYYIEDCRISKQTNKSIIFTNILSKVEFYTTK